MIRISLIAAMLSLFFALVPASQAGEMTAELAQVVNTAGPDQPVRVWIELNPVPESAKLKSTVTALAATRSERHRIAATQLHENHSRAQEGLLRRLGQLQTVQRASRVKPHWIVNVVEAEVAAGDIAELAARSDVKQVLTVPQITLIAPPESKVPADITLGTDSITTNLQYIKANQAWGMGYTGAGRLICSFDTGIEGSHPALATKWKGLDGDSAAAWYDPLFGEKFPHTTSSSVIPGNHGSHTMGIMCGRDDSINLTIGVAPGAKWISAAVVDVYDTSILDAFEWAADPDGDPNTIADVPDVINHSWGFAKNVLHCENIFFDAIRASEALGIVNIFAAGNGSFENTIANPGNGADDQLDCFAVGNLDATLPTPSRSASSSQGPSDCDGVSTKPNVMAPGNQIVSAKPLVVGDYGTMDGTSMAAPHVSGLVALLRQKNPNATVDEIKLAILNNTQSEVLWNTLPNNAYGWGAIDCVAALTALNGTNATPNVRVYDFTHDPIAPGDTVTGTLVLKNLGATVNNLSAALSGTQPSLNVLNGSASFGSIDEGDTLRSGDIIRVVVSDTVTIGSILTLNLQLTGTGYSVTRQLHFVVEPVPTKAMFTHSTGRIQFTVSNYGVFGLGLESMFSAGGEGFRFDGAVNDLWEGGVMIGTGVTRVSSRIHSYADRLDGDFKEAPGGDMVSYPPSSEAVERTFCAFSDDNAYDPIGVRIEQETFSFESPDDDFIILRYKLENPLGTSINNLYFGLMFDWDIQPDEGSNAGGWEADNEFGWMAYNTGTALSQFRGVKLLDGVFAGMHTGNAPSTIYPRIWGGDGFSTAEKYMTLTSGVATADVYKTAASELFQVITAGPYSLAPGESTEVTFAVLAGVTLGQIEAAAIRAQARVLPQDPEDDPEQQLLPERFALHQNYPNPFNPNTVISFDLPKPTDYTLDIYNVLGQKVFERSASARAGQVRVEWNAGSAASGVYFYRVTADEFSATRKMLLLK